MTVSKVINSCRKITPFGGLNFVIDHLQKKKIPELFDEHFGPRVKQAKYSYSSILLSWIYAGFCGTERLEDIMAIKADLEKRPGFKVPSSDRISQIFRSFATEKINFNTNVANHEFNLHPDLNKLMLKTALKLHQVKGDVLDYDNTIIYTEKWDARMTYQHEKGYQPAVGFIGKTPVYVENRNGNTPASYKMDETVHRMLDHLDSHKIKVKWFRSDSAAYEYRMVKLLNDRDIKFVIKAVICEDMEWDLKIPSDWKPSFVFGRKTEVISVEREFGSVPCRYVCFREPLKKGGYSYWAFITNEFDWSEDKVVRFYLQRGACERNFDDLKNNFNWDRVPFSLMNENTVFLIISAIACIIYYHVLGEFCKKVDWLKRNFRLKNFRLYFINAAAWWGAKGWLYVDSLRKYEVLLE